MTGFRQLLARYGANRRFWKHTSAGAPGECWRWGGPTTPDGAPAYDGVRADTKAYELARGPVPRGAGVRHTCGNPSCVNPDHLELTTSHRGAE
jgi:hypothetical protein